MPQYSIPHRRFNIYYTDFFKLFFLVSFWIIAVLTIPNDIWHHEVKKATVLIGTIGTWRYSWWLLNLARGYYFGKIKYPRMRKKADLIWESGWRPSHVHFLITTYNEKKETTEKVLEAITKEVKNADLFATIWVAAGAGRDIEIINEFMSAIHSPKLEIVFVHDAQPGKRVAIGAMLRALSRRGIGQDDIAFLMDGDSIMDQDVLRKCVSMFGAYKDLGALTTDEEAIVIGPKWFDLWLKMRFAQRRMWMQSHAVSNKVLTLTGRMSAFRPASIIEKEFIRTVESDHLTHWLWGRFRFLSGDDKSTWYTLLKHGALMTYLPDAMVYTVEHIEGNGYKRMRENLMRWSGNMLRNGTRAIMLGPRKVTPYIWWCLIDQRISMWTVIISLSTAIFTSLFVKPLFIISYILWLAFTRTIMASVLYCYSGRIFISFPLLIYINQIVSSVLKIYILFRLPRQKWANRSNQQAGGDVMASPYRRAFAVYLNIFYLVLMMTFVLFMSGILKWPAHHRIMAVF